MPLTYRYDQENRTVETEATGVITTGEMLSYVKSVIADDRVEPGFIEIVDFGPVEDMVVKYTEIEPFKALWIEYLQKGCRATILLAPTDMSYGTLRMLQTVIGLSQEEAANRFMIVRSRDELEASLKTLRT
jgi:hypothetical protein